ncbi:hypothetical protein M9458_040561, partial [Cirrhinus mrigala]
RSRKRGSVGRRKVIMRWNQQAVLMKTCLWIRFWMQNLQSNLRLRYTQRTVQATQQMTQSLISAMQLTSNCLLWWSGPKEYLISPICLWMIRSFCFEQ